MFVKLFHEPMCLILRSTIKKDKKYVTAYTGEDELFKKYNPLIAGCIQGSRDVLARDIIAVILNLIDKKLIKMEILPSARTNESYTYILSRPSAKEETEMFSRFWPEPVVRLIMKGYSSAYKEYE